MTKSAKRRWIALLLPLPLVAAGVLFLKFARPGHTVELALTFPEFCVWYLGAKSLALAKAAALGVLVSAVGDCAIATSTVIAFTLLLLRGYGPD